MRRVSSPLLEPTPHMISFLQSSAPNLEQRLKCVLSSHDGCVIARNSKNTAKKRRCFVITAWRAKLTGVQCITRHTAVAFWFLVFTTSPLKSGQWVQDNQIHEHTEGMKMSFFSPTVIVFTFVLSGAASGGSFKCSPSVTSSFWEHGTQGHESEWCSAINFILLLRLTTSLTEGWA